jgi:Lectin C-type domain
VGLSLYTRRNVPREPSAASRGSRGRRLVAASLLLCLQGCVALRVVQERGDSNTEGDAASTMDAQPAGPSTTAEQSDVNPQGAFEAGVPSPTPPHSAADAVVSEGEFEGGTAELGGAEAGYFDAGILDSGTDAAPGAGVAAHALWLDRGSPTGIGGAVEGANGPPLLSSVCPFNEVFTGLRVWTHADSTSSRYQTPMGLSAICSAVNVHAQGDGWQLQLTETRQLRRWGDGYAGDSESELSCPAGNVVVGVGGLAGSYVGTEPDTTVIYVDSVRLLCAQVTVDSSGQLSVGAAESTAELGRAPDGSAVFDYQCPNNTIARGMVVAAGAWIDSLGVVCAQGNVKGGAGDLCETPDDCMSSVCDEGRCVDPACLPSDCDCAMYGSTTYSFCGFANWSTADATCSDSEMALASLANAAESGWLRATTDALGWGGVWIGGSDTAAEGVWQWTTGEVFWDNGILGESNFAQWAVAEPNVTNEASDCAQVRAGDGLWQATDCTLRIPFVCEQ